MRPACAPPVVLIGKDGALLRVRQVEELPKLREGVRDEVLADAVVGDCMTVQGSIRVLLDSLLQKDGSCK
jgi:hypothetical protein